MKRWIAIAGAAAAAFVAIYTIEPAALDLDVARWIAAHRDEGGVTLAEMASNGGSVYGIVPLALLIGAWLYRRDGLRPIPWLALAVVGATALYLVFNHAIERARPPTGLRVVVDTAYSFPSGHATQSVAFWLIAAALIGAPYTRRVRMACTTVALVMIALIGGSRIYLGAHWTTDVLGGYALGACWLATVLALRAWRQHAVL